MKYEELLKLESIKDLSQNEQIDVVGNLFDWSYDHKNLDGVNHSFKLSQQIEFDKLTPENKVNYNYDIANGWHYLAVMKVNDTDSWINNLHELTQQIYHLRKAIILDGFSLVQPERQCQILINLGNLFSQVGRFVEAQAYWDRALKISPFFAMALGNKGYGIFTYQEFLFDPNHKTIFVLHAYQYLHRALELKQFLEGGAENFFRNVYDHLHSEIPDEFKNALPVMDDFPFSDNEQLKSYQLWLLENRLYLNPLNDISKGSTVSHDCINLSSIVFETDAPPVYFTLFNQIKQEFGTARFMFRESVQDYKPHYSDTDIVILETNELAKYSFYIEQLKIAFRMSYSILDKISFLLNDYLKLGIPEHEVGFRTIWFAKKKSDELRDFFKTTDNWALKGLFWLSRDIYERDVDFNEVLEPEAKELARIRNHIEHKSFKVVSDYFPYPDFFNEAKDISYTIPRKKLEEKTLKLLKLTRAAIIYLALAINYEESKKDYSKYKLLTIPLNTVALKHKI